MAPSASGQERFPATAAPSTGPQPDDAKPDDAALASALSRHELALARLRLELPSPSDGAVRELEAAERGLRAVLAQRDRVRR